MEFTLNVSIDTTKNSLPSWAKYIAIDKNGCINVFETMPKLEDEYWVVNDSKHMYTLSNIDLNSYFWLKNFTIHNWQNTLTEIKKD